MIVVRLLVFAASLVSAYSVWLPPAAAAKRVALVIGNDQYKNLTSLEKAFNDATAVGDALRRLGFEVIRGRDLSRQGMIDKIDEFTSRLAKGDTALFFYAGHGVAIDATNYLVPTDAPAATSEGRVRGASISEGDIVAEIQGRGARVAVLVLDACRDNPFPKSGTRSVGNSRGLTDAKNPARGIFVLYSAGAGQLALDKLEPNDPNRNGVFTRVFVDKLVQPSLHLGDLAIEVRERVAELALTAKNEDGDAVLHEQTPAYYDQTIGGRIYLAARPIEEPMTKPSATPLRESKQFETKANSRKEAAIASPGQPQVTPHSNLLLTPLPFDESTIQAMPYGVVVTSQRSAPDALAAYRSLQAKFSDLLSGRQAYIRRADIADRGVYYRAFLPFQSSSEAGEFCGRLKSVGGLCVVQRN